MKTCYRQALALGRRYFSGGAQLRYPSTLATTKIPSSTLIAASRTNTFGPSASVQVVPLNKQEQRRRKSSVPARDDNSNGLDGPAGDLFSFPDLHDDNIVGMTGSIRRSFGAQSNADAMIICGGEALAAHASFDPNFNRAKDWIRAHPVGPAVLSPVLVSGLVGALVEAAFPKSIPIHSSMQFLHPLIVGVEVNAQITVIAAAKTGDATVENDDESDDAPNNNQPYDDIRKRNHGHQVDLLTEVVRINDAIVIAQGTHSVWIPDYLHM